MKKLNYPSTNYPLKQQGFVTILTVSLVFLFLVSLFFLTQLFNYLDTEKTTLHICRKELLRTQTSVSGDLERLLGLNSLVKSTRVTKKTAQAMIMSGTALLNPPLILAGERLLAVALKLEKAIVTLQTFHLQSARFKMSFGLLPIYQKIVSELNLRRARQASLLHGDLVSRLNPMPTIPRFGKPAIRTIQSDDGPPEFELEENFTFKQGLHISWKYTLESGKPGGQHWQKIKITKKNFCEASLKYEHRQFRSLLIGGSP